MWDCSLAARNNTVIIRTKHLQITSNTSASLTPLWNQRPAETELLLIFTRKIGKLNLKHSDTLTLDFFFFFSNLCCCEFFAYRYFDAERSEPDFYLPCTSLNLDELQRSTLRRTVACWQVSLSDTRICSSNNYVLSQHSLKILLPSVPWGPFKILSLVMIL